jgi:hypothetical protein
MFTVKPRSHCPDFCPELPRLEKSGRFLNIRGDTLLQSLWFWIILDRSLKIGMRSRQFGTCSSRFKPIFSNLEAFLYYSWTVLRPPGVTVVASGWIVKPRAHCPVIFPNGHDWPRPNFCQIREKSASFPTLSRLCHGLATNTEDCRTNIPRFESRFMPNYHDLVGFLGITPRCLHDNVKNHPELSRMCYGLSRMCYGLSRLLTIVWRVTPKFARHTGGTTVPQRWQ